MRPGARASPEMRKKILKKIWLDTEEGRVEAWLIPGDDVSAERPGPAVVFTHGNAELIDYWPAALAGYQKLGATLLLPEYRGYGRSAGSPSQEKICPPDQRQYWKDLSDFLERTGVIEPQKPLREPIP